MNGFRRNSEISDAAPTTQCRLALALTLAVLAGCPAQQQPSRVANPNRYIYVSSGSLPQECYRDLGAVGFDQSFAASTIDEEGSKMASRLRALAVEAYPKDVDAIINVHPQQNDAGTMVRVSGEAVEVVDHPTVMCALRQLPPIIDASAAAANAGIIGTVAGGLISGSPDVAMGAGMAGAAAVGGSELIAHQQNTDAQREQLYRRLLDQQQLIRSLLTERACLNKSEQEEISAASCEGDSALQKRGNPRVSTPEDYQNLSFFDLQKQSSANQDYITKLQQQVSDMKWQIDHPTMQ